MFRDSGRSDGTGARAMGAESRVNPRGTGLSSNQLKSAIRGKSAISRISRWYMSRPVFVISFLALALQVSQAQLSSHGAPASVVSPTGNGVQHGAPASVLSPTPLPFGVNPPLRTGVRVSGQMRRFGSHQHRSQPQVFVPVPLFYPIYSDGAYPS